MYTCVNLPGDNAIMNTTKKINVNFSSLVGLKAELLRKQAEVNEVKLKNESISGLPQMNKKRNKRNVKDAKKDTKVLIEPDDIIAHKKSKLMLEAKARLYEKLKKSKNNNDNFLVDFKNKLDDSDEEFVDKAIDEKYPIEPEENWVEYQDCFGRTRKCLWKDLSHMQKKNELMKQDIMKRSTDADMEEENEEQFSAQGKEPEIEIMRQKWEQQTQKLTDKLDIHYQDILFDEARAHGVGYYAFSQDEDERVKQQENLANLRKETERKQMEMKEIKELKERMELNRLKAARIRQRIRAGLPAEPTEEELIQKDKISFSDNSYAEKNNEAKNNAEKSNEETVHKLPNTKKENACEEENNDEDKIKAFGELLGKKNWHVMSQEEWVHNCRTQRISEFGPIYDNFMNAGFYNSSPSVNEKAVYKDNENKPEIHNPEKSIKESDARLKNYNNFTSNEIGSNVRYIDSHSQNGLTECDAANENDMKQGLSINLTESITLIDSANLSNSQLSQVQPTTSYSLSHSSNYSQDICSNLEIHTHKQHKEMNELNIPLPGKNYIMAKSNTASTSSDCFTEMTKHNQKVALAQNINEDSIIAGLKYLREKFEETHSK